MPTTIPAENTALGNLNGSAYASLGTGLGLNMSGATPYSFECWVYPYSANATGTIFSQMGEYILSLNGGCIQTMRTNQLGPLTGVSVLPATTWSYVAVTFDGYLLSIYYNGNLEASQNVSDGGISPQGGPAQLGANNALATLSCDIEHFRAWKIGLTQADLNLFAYDPPLGPQSAMYTAIDFSAIPPVDKSGLGIPVNFQAGGQQQITAPALLLDGVSQYAVPTNISNIVTSGTAPYTIEAWVYFNTVAGQQCILCNSDASGNQCAVLYANGGLLSSQRGSVGTLASTTPLLANQWYNVATTYDGANLSIFINGLQDCTSPVAALPAGTTGSVQIGAAVAGGATSMYFNGYVQFLTFWNLALTQDQLIGILYEDPSNYPGIGANFDFSNALGVAAYANPAVDLTNGAPVTLLGTQAPTIQILRTTVSSAAQANAIRPTRVDGRITGSRQGAPGGVLAAQKPLACARRPMAAPNPILHFSDAHKMLMLQEFETMCLDGLAVQLQGSLRKQYCAAIDDTFDKLANDPDALKRVQFFVRSELGQHVLTFKMPDGTVFVARVSVVEFTSCQVWWGGFLFTLFYGLLSIYIRVPKEQLLNSIWVALRNEAAAHAFEDAVAGGLITFATLLAIVKAVYAVGLLKTVLWMIAKSLGWWGFGKFLATIAGLVVPVPTPSKAYAAVMCVVTVAQMGAQYVGSTTPPVPGYQQSCG